MSNGRRAFAVIALAAGAWAVTAVAEAQAPIRIGATLSQSGVYAALGQNKLRGYQLCVKHTNEKGGVLGRKLELVVSDDASDPATAVRLYEALLKHDKVDLILGPYGSPITDAVANVTERHKQPMVCDAAATSIYKKGRKFIFGVNPPAEVYLEGLIDLAVGRGLKTVGVIYEDTLATKAMAHGALELAKKRGLSVVLVEAYPKGTTNLSAILTRVRAANPDVLAAGTYFDDAVTITRQLRALGVSPRIVGLTVGVDLPKFYEVAGRDAEFVYGSTPWLPELVEVRAGGLIPIARQYPGAREFVESYKREFPGADFSFHSAHGYGSCEILVEAIRRAGALDGDKIRDAILKMDRNTVYGAFRVDRDGLQIAHKTLLFQWQDGKKVIVWPEELAAGKPRFPTPPWSERP